MLKSKLLLSTHLRPLLKNAAYFEVFSLFNAKKQSFKFFWKKQFFAKTFFYRNSGSILFNFHITAAGFFFVGFLHICTACILRGKINPIRCLT